MKPDIEKISIKYNVLWKSGIILSSEKKTELSVDYHNPFENLADRSAL